MGTRVRNALAACACLLNLGLAAPAAAQSADGYHAVQVFPVVVDSASFVQRFNFQNNNAADITLTPRYYPGAGTTQATPLTCPNLVVPANGEKVVTSLRAMCPALGAGSQFGFLHVSHAAFTGPGYQTYAAFSRVSNIAGAGFSVEAFPASTFSAATTTVTGIRRLAASGGAPSFQTNCFVANMPLFDTVAPGDTPVHYVIRNSAGAQIGAGDVVLPTGSLVRLLDIFTAGGVAVGDQDDAMISFMESGPSVPALIAFCTVQDNTSFGADFRIAKASAAQPMALVGPFANPAQDLFVPRDILMSTDPFGRALTIPIGNFNNVHVLAYHAPDYGQCEIINPSTGQVATAAYGLEIRAMTADGQALAGGNDSVVVPDPTKGQLLYLGDKDENPANQSVFLQVESNGQNSFTSRPYRLRCRSGSGLGLPHIVRYQQSGTEF